MAEGIVKLEDVVKSEPNNLADLAYLYKGASRDRDAQNAVRRLVSLSGQRYVPAYCLAGAYSAIGDTEAADKWMKAAIASHELALFFINSDPFDPMRRNPHFHDWLKKIGLEK